MNAVELKEGEPLELSGFNINTISLNHPVKCFAYRIEYNGKVFVYLVDNETYNIDKNSDSEINLLAREMSRNLVKFISNADCVIADAQYLPAEYAQKKGWGHSTTHHVVNLALKAKVKHVLFSHYDPLRTDDELDAIVKHYRSIVAQKGYPIKIDAAVEGNIIEL